MLCENSDVELARRISVSILSFWRADCTGKLSRKKAIEKIILRVFGSSEFSHGLGQKAKFRGDRRMSASAPKADISRFMSTRPNENEPHRVRVRRSANAPPR